MEKLSKKTADSNTVYNGVASPEKEKRMIHDYSKLYERKR